MYYMYNVCDFIKRNNNFETIFRYDPTLQYKYMENNVNTYTIRGKGIF